MTTRSRRILDVLLAAMTFALAAGAFHAVVSWVRRDMMHDLLRTWMSPDTAWMAPLGYLVIFLPLAMLLAAAAAVLPRLPALRVATFAFASLAVFGGLLLFPRLHQYASLVLGIGMGTRLAGVIGADASRWRPRLARAALFLALVTLGAWGYQAGRRALHERNAMAALGLAPAGAPDVLLLILDTVRANALSLYGAERATTPKLDRFAQAAVTFDWAFATAPWTLPSHASLFTGRYPSQQAGDWTHPLDGTHPTLAGVFASYGYATAGFTANLVATPRGFGLDQGFTRYEDHRHSLGQLVLTTTLGQAGSLRDAWDFLVRARWMGGAARALARFDFEPRFSYPDNAPKSADMVMEAFLRWQAVHRDRPYFAFLNFFDAHGPYTSPARYDTIFGRSDRGIDKYDRSIRYLDDALASLFDSLAARGTLDNTIVVVTADHGEQFGEHGLGWHSNSLYEQLLHVPLVIRYPSRVPAGKRVAQQVSLRDLAATLVELSGLPDPRGLGGTSLAATWRSPEARGSAVVSEVSRAVNPDSSALNALGNMRSLADDSLHYIRNGDGSFELYAYRRDPSEESNLANGSHRLLVPALDSALRRALADTTLSSATVHR